MTDFSTHRSTHPAPLFPIALNGVFYAGSVRSPYILSMPANITYWRDRLKLKLILIDRLSRVAISFRAGPRIWACAWPPTEKAPLESFCIVGCLCQSRWNSHIDRPGHAWVLYKPRRECNGLNSGDPIIPKPLSQLSQNPLPNLFQLSQISEELL